MGELHVALADSLRLMPLIQAELELREATLRADQENYMNLLEIDKGIVAVRRSLEGTLVSSETRTRQRRMREQWGFWLAVLALTVPVGLLSNYLY